MPSLNYDFVFRKDDKVLVFPVKVSKTIEDNWKSEDNLICDTCEQPLKQFYECENCEKNSGLDFRYTIGEIKKRKNKDTEIVFTKAEYDGFMKQAVKTKIEVVSELPIERALALKNLELVEGNFFEIFNNDEDYSNYVQRVRQHLESDKVALMVVMGYYGRNRSVLIIASGNKLLGVFLRDYRVVRELSQKLEVMTETYDEMDKALREFTIDKNIDNYYKFLELKKAGVPIEVKVEEKKEKSNAELDDFFEKKKKKIAVEVKS